MAMIKLARGRKLRAIAVAATLVSVAAAACSPAAETGSSSPSRSTATGSPDKIESFLLSPDEIRALRTSQDGPAEWIPAASDKPGPSLIYGPVQPARCNDAVEMVHDLKVEQWAQYRSKSLSSRKEYWITQTVASFRDEDSAKKIFDSIKDSLSACGNTSGLYPRERSNDEPFPFSLSLRDISEASARWTYVIRGTPTGHDPSTTEIFVGIARNTILHVSIMELADAAPLSAAIAQAITQRVLAAR